MNDVSTDAGLQGGTESTVLHSSVAIADQSTMDKLAEITTAPVPSSIMNYEVSALAEETTTNDGLEIIYVTLSSTKNVLGTTSSPEVTVEETTSLQNTPATHLSTKSNATNDVTTPKEMMSSECMPETEYECASTRGDCVPRTLLCDGYMDCADGSDEIGCECGLSQFRCVSGLCIGAVYRCDGFNDCGDYSDEVHGCKNLPRLGRVREVTSLLTASSISVTSPPTKATTAVDTTGYTKTSEVTLTSQRQDNSLCEVNVCLNGGVCKLHLDYGFDCMCPLEYTGHFCEEVCKPGMTCYPGNGVPTYHGFHTGLLVLSTTFVMATLSL